MAFIFQIISSFSAESFIRADTSLQNTSVSGLAVGIWPRGSRPVPVAVPAKAVSVLHPKGAGYVLPRSHQPGQAAPTPGVTGVEPPESRLWGQGSAASLPSSRLVCLFISGTGALGGHTAAAAPDSLAALLARAELLPGQDSVPLPVAAGSQSC